MKKQKGDLEDSSGEYPSAPKGCWGSSAWQLQTRVGSPRLRYYCPNTREQTPVRRAWPRKPLSRRPPAAADPPWNLGEALQTQPPLRMDVQKHKTPFKKDRTQSTATCRHGLSEENEKRMGEPTDLHHDRHGEDHKRQASSARNKRKTKPKSVSPKSRREERRWILKAIEMEVTLNRIPVEDDESRSLLTVAMEEEARGPRQQLLPATPPAGGAEEEWGRTRSRKGAESDWKTGGPAETDGRIPEQLKIKNKINKTIQNIQNI